MVASLIVSFVLLMLGVGVVRVKNDMQVERSRTAITHTLAVAHVAQSAYHAINQRFASWSELQERGVKLEKQQEVVASNATAYHWFLSVRDNDTGLVCSGTGELFDDGPDERKAACSGGL